MAMVAGALRRDESEPFSPNGAAVPGPNLASAVGWVLALLGFLIGSRTIGDNSFLTHLATGRLILDAGSVPRIDSYSYLAAGESWTIQSWSMSLIYAALDSALGPWSIRVLNGLFGAAIARGAWRLTERAEQLLTRVALLGIVLVIGTFLWSPRPLLIGLLGLVLIAQVVQGQRSSWLLIPLFWVWVNAHGSFVLGAAFLGFVLIGAAIDERRVPWSEVRLVVAGGVGCLSALIGPLGWSLLWFPVQLMSRREALNRVSEWTSPTFRSPIELLFLALLFVVVIGAARRAPWRALLPSVLFFMAGLVALRNLGPASIVVVAMMAPALSGLGGSVDGSASGLIPRAITAVAAVGLALCALVVRIGPAYDFSGYPVVQIDWLEERDLVATAPIRLAQRDTVGNYLTYRYGPHARVFMDDRFDFYPLSVVEDHATLIGGGDIEEAIDRNEFDVMLWQTDSALRRWLRDQPDWLVVVDDPEWFIACRTTSPYFARCQQ